MDQKIILVSALILIVVVIALLLSMQPGTREVTPPEEEEDEEPEVRFSPQECSSICQNAEYDNGECLAPPSAEPQMVKAEPCEQPGMVCYCYDEPEEDELLECFFTPLDETEHVHQWCEGEEYTEDFCNSEGQCHRHEINQEGNIAEEAGLVPHTHQLM